MNFAWDLTQTDPDSIANAPKWLDQDHYDILAKVSSESVAAPRPMPRLSTSRTSARCSERCLSTASR